jgi:hypothetical protein
MGIEVHGILWVSDQLLDCGQVSFAELHQGLLRLAADPIVFLPREQLELRIAQLRKLLGLPLDG